MSNRDWDLTIDHVFTNVVTADDCAECEFGKYYEDYSGTGDSPGAYDCTASNPEDCPVVQDYISKHAADDYDDAE